MVHTISFLHFCLSSICFIILILPAFCFIPSRISWLQGERGGSSSSDLSEDITIQNYQHQNDFHPYNSYRTSMPLPLSRFMNVFNENDEKNINGVEQEQPAMTINKFVKRGERLCGVRLLKKMNTLCNKCIKSPDTSPIKKRSGIPDMADFAAHCCSKGCDSSDLQQFCC